MNVYLKCGISFALAGLCLYLATTMSKDQQGVIYFLYLVAFVNFYIGVRDAMTIFRGRK